VTPRDPHRSAAEGYARYAGLGLQFAAAVGVFAWIGYWTDGKLGTSPIFLIAGVLLGFVGALVSLVRRVPPPRGAKRSRPPEPPR
jgi:F0F1-type ATP synthase assembly protein I